MIGRLFGTAVAAFAFAAISAPLGASAAPHNVILFVPDGLRASVVDAQTAPAMDALRRDGVNFQNSHSLFPTFTTANASAMATGHYLGDTGDFSNTIYVGFRVPSARLSVVPFLENDPVLGDVDARFGGNYLDETGVLAAARAAGYSTAAIGKLGPAAIMDVSERSGNATIIIDDATGHVNSDGVAQGLPLASDVALAMQTALGAGAVPGRGPNGLSGDFQTAGTLEANVRQQQFFADATTRVVLPLLKNRNKPFVLVFWSRDPDGTQHNQGDSLGKIEPGINGPTSLRAIKNADDNLAQIRAALDTLALTDSTDIIVSADHGFSTISKESKTSAAAQYTFPDVPAGTLSPGFVAIDIAKALGLPMQDPDRDDASIHPDFEHRYPSRGNALIGTDIASPDAVVAANGGSDLVYLPKDNAKALAPKIIEALLAQDYVSGLFVDDTLGTFPGTLPLTAINMRGAAITPTPAIAINFRSYSTGCAMPLRCTAEIADSNLQQGQGMHGTFSRADTNNFMAAIGPDFKKNFVDGAPVSNADVGMTMASLLGLQIAPKGTLIGRDMSEAHPGGRMPMYISRTMTSAPAGGVATTLRYQDVGTVRYFDAAGFAGRTVGL